MKRIIWKVAQIKLEMFGIGRRRLNQVLHTTTAVATVVIFWFVIYFIHVDGDLTVLKRLLIWLHGFEKTTKIRFLFQRWLILRLFRPSSSTTSTADVSAQESSSKSCFFLRFQFHCHHLIPSSCSAWTSGGFLSSLCSGVGQLRETDADRISEDAQVRQ